MSDVEIEPIEVGEEEPEVREEAIKLTFNVPTSLFVKIEQFREQADMNRSEFLRKAIETYLVGTDFEAIGEAKPKEGVPLGIVKRNVALCSGKTWWGHFWFDFAKFTKKMVYRGFAGEKWSDEALKLVLRQYLRFVNSDADLKADDERQDGDLAHFAGNMKLDLNRVRKLWGKVKEEEIIED